MTFGGRWKTLACGAAVAMALAIVTAGSTACSSDSGGGESAAFSCTGKAGHCPNDAPLTTEQTTECQMAEQDPTCGSLFTTLGMCVAANPSCDANGVSMQTNAACAAQEQAYAQCLLAALDAGTGG